jgi:hypothetical protein
MHRVFKARRAQQALAAYEDAHAEWQVALDALSEVIALARSGQGATTSTDLALHEGEHLLLQVGNTSLIEDRRGSGRWQGGSQGISFPIGPSRGRSVRYRVGKTRGHYIQGELAPTAIDHGDLYVTNERAVFRGAKQTRVAPWSKLITAHTDADGTVRLATSNRALVTVVHTGSEIAWIVDTRIRLGIAEFLRTVDHFVETMQTELETVRAVEPGKPVVA